jgi:hypothetical protein
MVALITVRIIRDITRSHPTERRNSYAGQLAGGRACGPIADSYKI